MNTLTALEARALTSEFTFLDVREADEFDAGHIPGAKLLPLSELSQNAAHVTAPLPKTESYVVYCKAGVRSKMAIDILRAQGFSKVQDMTDGYMGWTQLA